MAVPVKKICELYKITSDISINCAPAFGGFRDVYENNSQCKIRDASNHKVTRGENVALRQGWLAQSRKKY